MTTLDTEPTVFEEDTTIINIEMPEERRKPKRWIDAPRRTVLIFAAIFVATEAVGAFVSIPAQAALDALFAFIAVNIAIFGYRIQRTAGLVMTALFTERLLVLTLPATGVALTTRTAMIAILTVIIAYIATWVLGVDVTGGRGDEGYALKDPIVSRSFTSALTVLTGFPIGWAAYVALKPHQLVIQDLGGNSIVPWAVVISAFVIAALGEELMYRRLVAAMVQHTGQSQTPWISAILYASVFLSSRNPDLIAVMFVAGAIFAASCERTGSIKPVVTAHMIASLLVFVALPR